MANKFFNFLTGIGDKVKGNTFFQTLTGLDTTSPEYLQKKLQTLPTQENALALMEARENENLGLIPKGTTDDLNKEINRRINPNFGQKLANAFLGEKEQGEITTEVKDDGTLVTGISNEPRKGGILRDIAGGYQENRFNPISLDNLEPNKNKGFAYRIGEGLGSLARFGESPLGRGLLVGGTIGALGGNPTQMLAYGAGTTMMNQGNRMRDRVYRDDLINSQQDSLRNSAEFNTLSNNEIETIKNNLNADEEYLALTDEAKEERLTQAQEDYLLNIQQEQLQNIANNINSIRGYVDSGTYQQMQHAQQLRDNQAYRNMMLASQMQNQKDMMDYRIAQAQRDAENEAWQRDYNERKLVSDNAYKQGMLDVKRETAEARNKRMAQNKKLITALNDNKDALDQAYALQAMIKENPRAIGLLAGSLAKGNAFAQAIANRGDKGNRGNIKTRAGISKLRGTTMHDLAGTAQTLQEQKNLAPFLPDITDTEQTATAKLDQLITELKRQQSNMQVQLGQEALTPMQDENSSDGGWAF